MQGNHKSIDRVEFSCPLSASDLEKGMEAQAVSQHVFDAEVT